MQAVAQVVLNRARHPAFPKTICGVVFQGASRQTGCQFSFTCNGAMRGAVSQTAWTRARDVAARALSGEVFALVGTATHFHTTAVSPRWRHSLLQVAQVGDHVFYRFGGRAGARTLPKPAARATHAIDRSLSCSNARASSTRRVWATATGDAPRCWRNSRRRWADRVD